MISHRFRRRAFLTAVSGGVGLKIMLRNMELSAQTAQSPPRFLLTKWPLGIIPGASDALWKPTSGPAGGYALQPFADNGLAGDMITLRGVSTTGLNLMGGGGLEGGTVVLVTGVGCGGTRANRGEPDDGFAAGPSVDQILLRNVPALTPPGGGPGYANSIGDLRTDLGELSVKCLSYSYDRQPVTLYNNASTGTENIPLMPTLSPLTQYNNLFSGFVPAAPDGGPGGAPVADAMMKQLIGKKSALDFALDEIGRLKGMVPSDARNKLQNHYDAVESVETSLANAINTRYPTVTGTGAGTCAAKPAAPPNIQGMPDWTSGSHGNYGTPTNGSTNDKETHQTVGRLHMEVFRAAFLCDIIRCGTFSWAPATSHVGFQGMYPGDDVGIYQHCAARASAGSGSATIGTTPDEINSRALRFLFNVETWYFARQAENLKLWKDSVDGFGNPLLDTTIIPFVTENAAYTNERANIPCMLFGGKKLGMAVGQYKTGNFTVNSLWGTIALAFGYDATAAPDYNATGAALRAPIPGLWAKPT
jgi:hypothetical protein